jgi:hypothetical protein
MALIHDNSTVGTAATLVAEIAIGSRQNLPVYFSNADSQPIWIGDSMVTTTGANVGIRVAANANLQLWLNGGDKIYAVSAAGTAAGAVVTTYSA